MKRQMHTYIHMYMPQKYIDFLFSLGKRPDIFRTTEKKVGQSHVDGIAAILN